MSSEPVPTAKHRADVRPSGTSPQDLEHEIEATRQRLAGTLDQLLYRAHPKTIVRRKVDETKTKFVDAQGNPRMDKIATVAGAALGVVVLFAVVRRFSGRRH
ncbi:MAG: DUF3618 domain-containing protein [Actinomycetota bacterium]|nr:DUF3618 domain-containing protein [Actinomycetota bacterium]